MRPVRASYGAYNNSHQLLTCDNGSISLPDELEGLTDRPPGDITPGERWWPSLGCGPVGEWWCLWWTRPDLNASRSGMVHSEVALWPITEIGVIEDLTPALSELSGGEIIAPASEAHLALVADTLLNCYGKSVVVCESIDAWPGIIAGLWKRLWPTARMAFSARVALSPPQSGGSTKPPWIFGVPCNRSQQWQKPYSKVEFNAEYLTGASHSRAAWYVSGRNDDTMTAILEVIPPQQSNLMHLVQVARVADSLDNLQSSINYDDALTLLRTLITLAPLDNDAKQYKELAIKAIVQTIEGATFSQITSIANIALPSLPCKSDLELSLLNWVFEHAPRLPISESCILLSKLQPEKAQHWWQSNVKMALHKGINSLEGIWTNAMLNWLVVRDLNDVLSSLIPASGITESILLEAAKEKLWAKDAINQLRYQAGNRKWSVFHAWCAAQSMSVSEAFDAQCVFAGDPVPGLKYLVHNLPADDVVKAAVSRDDGNLAKLVAQLTEQHPSLLRWLDVSKLSSRMLWAAHIDIGGKPWPHCFQTLVQGRALLDAVTAGESSCGLVEFVAKYLVQVTVDHPQRAELWMKLNSNEFRALLTAVAHAVIEQLDENQNVTQPESVLSNAVVENLRNSKPSAWAVCSILSWQTPLNEHEVIKWVSHFTRDEWKSVASSIGHAVSHRHWKTMARELYRIRQTMPESKPAIEACQHLLSSWERMLFSAFPLGIFSRPSTPLNQTELANRVADIGSSLHPYELDDIWERAGGKRKKLKISGTPRSCWQHAANLAANGALKGCLLALVIELKKDFPNNEQLMEIEVVLRKTAGDVSDAFELHTPGNMHYTRSSDGTHAVVPNLHNKIQQEVAMNTSITGGETSVDIVIITALKKEEEAVLRHLGPGEHVSTKNRLYHKLSIQTDDVARTYTAVLLSLPGMGNVQAGIATTQAIDVWNPSYVLLCGISGGMQDKEKNWDTKWLGDLLVADQILAYEPGKLVDGGINRRYEVLRPAFKLVEAARNLLPEKWVLSAKKTRPDGSSSRVIPKTHFGIVASGEKVIADARFAEEIKSDWSRLAGFEMEGYGAALAAYQAETAPGMLMVKGICDWADDSKNDEWQEYAADISAAFISALLKSSPFPERQRPQAIKQGRSLYTGKVKLVIAKRIGVEWRDLADYFEIPPHHRNRFTQGYEMQGIWEWLEVRNKLDSLENGLIFIERTDLAEALRKGGL